MISRRTLLGGSATAGFASLAGCASLLGNRKSGQVPIAKWLPHQVDGEQTGYIVADVEAIAESVEPTRVPSITSLYGVSPEDIDALATGFIEPEIGTFAVAARGEFEKEAFRSYVEDSEEAGRVEAADSYEGFARYSATEANLTIGTDGDVAVAASSGALFEATVDAGRNGEDRVVDENPDVKLAIDQSEGLEWLQLLQHDIGEHLQLFGYGYEYGESKTDLSKISIYPDESTASDHEDDRRSSAEENYDEYDVELDGRSIIVTTTVPTEEALESQPDETSSEPVTPSVNFEYDYDDGAGTLEITHVGGDSFDAERVTISGPRAYGHDGNTWDQYDAEKGPDSTVAAGDEIVLGGGQLGEPLDSDFQIELVWESSDGDTTGLLGSTSGPDA